MSRADGLSGLDLKLYKLEVYAATCNRLIDFYRKKPGRDIRLRPLFWEGQLKETRKQYRALKKRGSS